MAVRRTAALGTSTSAYFSASEVAARLQAAEDPSPRASLTKHAGRGSSTTFVPGPEFFKAATVGAELSEGEISSKLPIIV